MHRLQQLIMHALITNPERRYSQLKPDNVEGNQFMYHLRSLIKAGWICKTDHGTYELTPEGKVYADQLSLQTFQPRVQPRIVSLLAVQNPDGQWLMYKRRRQPMINRVGFPFGKLHIGETVQQAAERELKEKTGLTAELTHRGDGYITIYEDDTIISQILFHLFYGHNPAGRLATSTRGVPFWADLRDIAPADFIPSVPELVRLLESHPDDRFFVELEYREPAA